MVLIKLDLLLVNEYVQESIRYESTKKLFDEYLLTFEVDIYPALLYCCFLNVTSWGNSQWCESTCCDVKTGSKRALPIPIFKNGNTNLFF